MRMSCNGCRVLRKGCSDDCSIRPCLEWIKSPDSQANATVFLAKFYGRAGLMNLINAGPVHLRPAIFRSLLYEACGRIVNPIYGSVGLMWSGAESWKLCQNAVEAVLRGGPIVQIADDAVEAKSGPPLKACDIRHVNKEEENPSGSSEPLRVRNRCRFKRTGAKGKRTSRVLVDEPKEVNRSPSHESSLSHQSQEGANEPSRVEMESRESESLGSAEPGLDSAGEDDGRRADDWEVELDLSLGFEPFKRCVKPNVMAAKRDGGSAEMELRLDYPASYTSRLG